MSETRECRALGCDAAATDEYGFCAKHPTRIKPATPPTPDLDAGKRNAKEDK